MRTLRHFPLQGKVPPLEIMTSKLEQGWMKQSACLAILGLMKLWVLPESMSIVRGSFWRTLWPTWFMGWWLLLRHGEISLVGRLEQEVVECHHHHLLDPEHHKKFQVWVENPHPRDGAFAQHIYVFRWIYRHNYNKSLFPDVPASLFQTNAW